MGKIIDTKTAFKEADFESSSIEKKMSNLSNELYKSAMGDDCKVCIEDIEKVLTSPDVVKAFTDFDNAFEKSVLDFYVPQIQASEIVYWAPKALPTEDMPALAKLFANNFVIQIMTKDRGKIYKDQEHTLSNISDGIMDVICNAENAEQRREIAKTLATKDVGGFALQHSRHISHLVEMLSEGMNSEEFNALLNETKILDKVPPIIGRERLLGEDIINGIALQHLMHDHPELREIIPNLATPVHELDIDDALAEKYLDKATEITNMAFEHCKGDDEEWLRLTTVPRTNSNDIFLEK